MTEHRHLERYFRALDQDVLGPGASGLACSNLRQALARLGFGGKALNFSDKYDDSLAKAVFDFQTRYKHSSRDGQCGPGTRALLARVMSEPKHRKAFKRWPDPERRKEGTHAFVSYAHEDAPRVFPFIELMREWDYEVWFDENLTPGSTWSTALETQVAEAWLVVVFLSQKSVTREWVVREMTTADQAARRVMPILLDALPAAHPLSWLDKHQYLAPAPIPSVGHMSENDRDKLAAALREAHAIHLAS